MAISHKLLLLCQYSKMEPLIKLYLKIIESYSNQNGLYDPVKILTKNDFCLQSVDDFVDQQQRLIQNTMSELHQQTTTKTQNDQLLTWIQSLNRQKNNKRLPLEEQLHFLTQSYKNAQEKLLYLQKQLYHQSLHNQKQRSIIEILKHLIQQNLDDDTILTYIVNLQQQNTNNSIDKELERKYQIRNQLEEIKEIIYMRKNKSIKVANSKDIAISDLKKEVKKINNVKRELMEDLEQLINEKEDLATKLLDKETECEQIIIQNQNYKQLIATSAQQIQKQRKDKSKLELQMQQAQKKWANQEAKQQSMTIKIHKFITKMQQCEASQNIGIEQWVEFICKKLQKYRNLSKQLSQKVLAQSRSHQLITVLRMFLPEEASLLIEEYQNKIENEFLLKELEDMAILYKKKISQVDICQQEMWSMKIRLLKDREENIYDQSSRASSTRQNKENLQPNFIGDKQLKVTEFYQ